MVARFQGLPNTAFHTADAVGQDRAPGHTVAPGQVEKGAGDQEIALAFRLAAVLFRPLD